MPQQEVLTDAVTAGASDFGRRGSDLRAGAESPADDPAVDVAYRVDDDLDAHALPDFDLITVEGADGVEPPELVDAAAPVSAD